MSTSAAFAPEAKPNTDDDMKVYYFKDSEMNQCVSESDRRILKILAFVLAMLVGLIFAVIVITKSNDRNIPIRNMYDPAYDHQVRAYIADHNPVKVQTTTMTITPFFNPEHGIDTLVEMIEQAQFAIDIGTPGMLSWIGCSDSPFTVTDSPECIGCLPSKMRNNETFSIFPALLNAVHRKVAVRLLTNSFDLIDCPGFISPLTFLYLNGVDVRFYTSTTFYHGKFMHVDFDGGSLQAGRLSISSDNYSYTSFMENREAGVILEGQGVYDLADFLHTVFEDDFAVAVPYDETVPRPNIDLRSPISLPMSKPYSPYSKAELDIILDPKNIEYTVPPLRPEFVNKTWVYVTSKPVPLTDFSSADITVSPDFARSIQNSDMNSIQKSFKLYIYQVTDEGFCDKLIQLYNRKIDVRILLSHSIYDVYDCDQAIKCSKRLYAAGLTNIKLTNRAYVFSHQKYWIIDGERMAISTGNWSPSDYPQPVDENKIQYFPAWPNAGWRSINRDMTVYFTHPSAISVYNTVFDQDYAKGTFASLKNDVKCVPHRGDPPP